ncbi:hypothetical protein [Clostridium beijerinckii]|uniref:hypothetical protein n=1 Tax=Clostridium beijerinckii TaxID=1520 RepID=UPI00098CE2F1|nr:hypothetical protein [Clostridium beijerinckii]NRU38891.1 hypothetical protein [Clostridium beijerinckii]NSA97830.1 hypothetical protein [Clostridium beijerinckii]OOM68635.1 hypothetical protein CLOBI_01900 [Clostridium beijerinckii]OOM72656.1 hypothetical protein CLBEIC_06650 [Clostridium beijerinckii]CUU48464.1 conserved protein of unknown function [Clostridium beijerinckii]
MIELLDHPAYKIINKYKNNGVVVDYVIIQNDSTKHTYEEHKKAAINAMKIIAKRWDDYAFDKIGNDPNCKNWKREDFFSITWDESSLSASAYPIEQFFALPEDSYYIDKPETKTRAWSTDQFAQYAYTFLEPPYSNKYVIKDWEVLNNILFSSKEDLEIYKWSTNWSNYFNDGLEWWGAYYWTVYDFKYNIFVVIGASATD